MKKLLLIICISTTAMVKAQVTYPEVLQQTEPEHVPEVQVDTVQEPRRQPAIQDYFKPYIISTAGLGNNVLAKANDNGAGLGFGINFYTYKEFSITGGIEFTTYKITDVSMTANGTNTDITSFYAGVEYKKVLSRHFSLIPSLCYAFSQMTHSSSYKDFGIYNGNGIRAGTTLDFAVIIPNLKLFVGANFTHTWYGINTLPEYRNYYRHVSTINAIAGIKIAFI
jgi:hypothetical protein